MSEPWIATRLRPYTPWLLFDTRESIKTILRWPYTPRRFPLDVDPITVTSFAPKKPERWFPSAVHPVAVRNFASMPPPPSPPHPLSLTVTFVAVTRPFCHAEIPLPPLPDDRHVRRRNVADRCDDPVELLRR